MPLLVRNIFLLLYNEKRGLSMLLFLQNTVFFKKKVSKLHHFGEKMAFFAFLLTGMGFYDRIEGKTSERRLPMKFSEMPYTRPDIDAMRKLADEIALAIANAKTP